VSRSLQSNAKLRPFYLTTAGGQIRAWRVGMGPDVVILAGLALAAAVTAERAAVACPGFRITALELPGIGGSADHDADEAGAISAALAEAIGIAGVEGCVLVGCDLAGALVPQVAAQLAVAPVAAVSLGGERAKAWNRSGINPPDLAPRTDGTLLTALWLFLRDRHVLRADDPTQPAPSGEPIPTPSELDATLVAAAVRPVRFARLWSELCRVSNDLEPAADLQGFAELATMLSPTLDAAMAEPSGTKPLSGDRIWHHEVETPRGRMHLRRVGGEGRPLLVLPTGGGSSAQFAPVLRGLAAGRQTFSVDYLGNGLSAKPHRSTVTIDDLAEDMAALIDALGFREVDVWGSHTGAVVGLELALRHPVKVGRLVMEGPVFVSPDFQTDLLERYFPPIAPDGWGRHLQLVWNWHGTCSCSGRGTASSARRPASSACLRRTTCTTIQSASWKAGRPMTAPTGRPSPTTPPPGCPASPVRRWSRPGRTTCLLTR